MPKDSHVLSVLFKETKMSQVDLVPGTMSYPGLLSTAPPDNTRSVYLFHCGLIILSVTNLFKEIKSQKAWARERPGIWSSQEIVLNEHCIVIY